MITGRQLQVLISRFAACQPGEVDQRTRHLYEKNLIPQGPRGTAAPRMQPLHASLMLLCMVSRRASDAAAIMVRVMDLQAVVPAGSNSAIADGMRLAPTLAARLLENGPKFDRVEILGDGSLAWAELNGQRILFTDDDQIRSDALESPSSYAATGSMYCGHRLVITAGLAAQIALELAEHDSRAGFADDRQRKAG